MDCDSANRRAIRHILDTIYSPKEYTSESGPSFKCIDRGGLNPVNTESPDKGVLQVYLVLGHKRKWEKTVLALFTYSLSDQSSSKIRQFNTDCASTGTTSAKLQWALNMVANYSSGHAGITRLIGLALLDCRHGNFVVLGDLPTIRFT